MSTVEEVLPVIPAGRGAARFLRGAGVLWFVIAAIGQTAFIYFIIAFYGSRTLMGDFAAWNEKPLIDGYIEGDGVGNAGFISHVLLAAVMTFGGLLQLVPKVRRASPVFHRWNGRVFLLIACFLSIGGLALTWGRGTYLSLPTAVAVSGNALVILACAAMTGRTAMARRMEAHRRWAMRTFMVANGVWFLRVGYMGWVILNQGAVGMNESMSGPVDIGMAFASYLVPLALLELYFAAQRARQSEMKLLGGAVVVAATLFMSVGVFGAVTLMWGPYL